MRNVMVGLSVLGLLVVGTVAGATAHPLAVPPVGPSVVFTKPIGIGMGVVPAAGNIAGKQGSASRSASVGHRIGGGRNVVGGKKAADSTHH